MQRSGLDRAARWCRVHPRVTAVVAAAVVALAIIGGVTDHQHKAVASDDQPSSAATSATSTPSARSGTTVGPQQHLGRTATAVLATLVVKGRAPMTGYSRSQFGDAWTDDNDDPLGHNGCDTRDDVLRRDLTDGTVRPGTNGCVLLSGSLHDPYTGSVIAFRRGPQSAGVQIDHVVALGDAWQTGARYWTKQTRTDLANDPLELLAVDGPTNEAKGDGDAATWLPPNKAYRCAYVARQIAVKARYHLWMTAAERAASQRVLSRCPGQRVPSESGAPVVTHAPGAASSTRSASKKHPAPATSAARVSGECTRTTSGKCIRHGQFCSADSYGRTGTDAGGRTWTCAGNRARPHWQ